MKRREKFVITLLIVIFFLLWAQLVFGAAGQITEISGPTQISRGNDKIKGELKVDIESNDKVETLNSKTGITFIDDTHVTISEHSKLIIDDFVFDPKSSSGKIGLKASLGTVRYLSGRIAHNNHNNVNVQTPTASIAVRGTDFSMTVDEMGKSLVILLPTKIGNRYVVGKIDVTTSAGTVTLDKAFEGTFVNSNFVMPTPPTVFRLDEGGVNNNLLLDSPKSAATEAAEKAEKVAAEQQQEQAVAIAQMYATAQAIQKIDSATFVFKQDDTDASKNKLKSNFKSNIISISVPNGENVTVNYTYEGGKVSAKNGTGIGVTINVEQH